MDHVLPANIFNFTSQIAKLSKWIAAHRKIDFNDFYSFKIDYNKRYNIYKYLIDKEKLNGEIDYLEFGVSKGYSFKWWAENNKNSNSRFYGFDTFEGLPEDWGPYKKGDMSSENKIPEMDDDRCSFYRGLFQQSLPGFLKKFNSNKRKVIHLDADLYSSTLFVLTSLSPFLQKDDILIFDEFNVPMHEFKAFTEWVNSFYIQYEVLAASNNYFQVAIKLL